MNNTTISEQYNQIIVSLFTLGSTFLATIATILIAYLQRRLHTNIKT